MKATPWRQTYWAAVSDETNKLDGRKRRINLYNRIIAAEEGRAFMLFKTREQCRRWIKETWGYLQHRPDLREEPHCWRVPRPRRVTMTVREL
jgi:hypothetical protein